MPGYIEFELDLPGALLSQILEKMDGLEPAPLTNGNIDAEVLDDGQGIYALYTDNGENLAYIGKTDGNKGLKDRLKNHSEKLSGRQNIEPQTVFFKAVRLFVFTAMDIEKSLIQHFRARNPLPWNHSGFGSKDPGRKRDTSAYKENHFDRLYPIDLDRSFYNAPVANAPISTVLLPLMDALPYTLRVEKPDGTKIHDDFYNYHVDITRENLTTREILTLCGNSLPNGWHITALPSHIIAYKNDNRQFPEGEEISRP